MSGLNLEIVRCNDRGPNSPAKSKALREFADSLHAAIFCIKETKLAMIDQYTIMECLGRLTTVLLTFLCARLREGSLSPGIPPCYRFLTL